MVVDKAPKTLSVFPYFVLLPFFVWIVKEGSKETRVQMVQNESKEMFVELKRKGKLLGDLPDTIDELKEDWRPVIVIVLVFSVTNAMSEFMAKTQPFFFYQNLKAFQGPVK